MDGWMGPRAFFKVLVALCVAGCAFVVALPAGAATTGGADSCGYSDSTFNENTVMRGAKIIGTGSTAEIAAFANDEKGLLLGVNGATPVSSATSNGTNSYVATNASGGSMAVKDPSGRYYFPALYITKIPNGGTSGPGAAGDFQTAGSAPRNVSGGRPFVDDVFGEWSTATVSSGGAYSVTPPPAKNNWSLGAGADAPTDTSFNDGYGAEVRWNVSELTDNTGQALQPGSTYRIQVIEHDGDQNKTGGDAGEFCVNLTIPGVSTQATGTATVGQAIHDTAVVGGTNNSPGTVTWNVYDAADKSCSTPLNSQPSSLTQSVSGDGVSVTSPDYIPTRAGTYQWVANYRSNDGSITINSACNTAGESTVVNPASPQLQTIASDGLAGHPVHDIARLIGGYNPDGSITWSVYAGSDSSCSTPLFTSSAVTVSGAGDYSSPAWTPTSNGNYQWVANYTGDANNTSQTSGCGNEPFKVGPLSPQLKVTKLESFSNSSGFVPGPLTGQVGQTVYYQMNVFNTGNTPLKVQFSDPGCDSNTLSGPSTVTGSYDAASGTLASGGELQWTCSHVLTAGDVSGYTNTAAGTGTVTGTGTNQDNTTAPCSDGSTPPCKASVVAYSNTPGMSVVKLQRIGDSGAFTASQLTGSVGDTVNYEIQVSNTGNQPLTLSISDPHCDSAPVGPTAVSGTLNGNVLAAGGVAQYTCSHVLAAGDIPQFTNVATVTGTPPSGPPLTGTGIVVVNVTQAAIKVLKLQSLSASGTFTTDTITARVGQTIYYEIQATNTGNAPLTLSISDPMCDSGTLQGPVALSGSLSAGVLSPSGEAQYTCSHVLTAGDANPFTNTATVTGTPPSGPPVSGTSSVNANKQAVRPTHIKRCPAGTVKKTKRNKKGKKVIVCKAKKLSHRPKRVTGFTG